LQVEKGPTAETKELQNSTKKQKDKHFASKQNKPERREENPKNIFTSLKQEKNQECANQKKKPEQRTRNRRKQCRHPNMLLAQLQPLS